VEGPRARSIRRCSARSRTGSRTRSPPATLCGGTVFSGTFAATGATRAFEPYNSPAGVQKACLSGPAGVDFDLYLYKWSGSGWYVMQSSLGPTASESITINAPAGRYYWEVKAFSGTGAYSFELTRP